MLTPAPDPAFSKEQKRPTLINLDVGLVLISPIPARRTSDTKLRLLVAAFYTIDLKDLVGLNFIRS